MRPLAALLALFGFLFTASTPGLSLVAMSGPGAGIANVLGFYICHAQGGDRAVPMTDEGPADSSDGCCLICQVAHMASGAVPPQHFTLPTESAAHLGLAVAAQSVIGSSAFTPVQPRAPPSA
jgi:hypothetical protein